MYRAGAGDPDLTGMGTTVVALAVVAHDGDEFAGTGQRGRFRATVLGWQARPAHHRSQPGGGPGAGGQPVARRGVHPPAAQHPHPGPRRVRGRAGRRLRRRAPPRRPLPAVLRRAVQRGPGGRHRRRPRRLGDPAGAADELVRLAREGGGRDNITVVVVDVVDDGRAERPPPLAGEPTRSAPVVGAPSPAGPTPTTGPRPRWRRRRTRAVAATPPRTATTPTTARTVTGTAPCRPPQRAGSRGGWPCSAGAAGGRRRPDRHHPVVRPVRLLRGAGRRPGRHLQGRPGGLLWIEPTLVETSGLDIDQVPEAGQHDIEAGKEQPRWRTPGTTSTT